MPVYFGTATIGTNIALAGSASPWLIGFPESDTGSIASTGYSDYCFFSGFGFAVPPTDTILGIVVEYSVRALGTFVFPFGVSDNSVMLGFSNGTLEGVSRAQGAMYSRNIFTAETRGAANDLWGWPSISSTDINDPTFGFGLSSIIIGPSSNCIFEVLTAVTMSIATQPGATKAIPPIIAASGGSMTRIPNIGFGTGENSVRF